MLKVGTVTHYYNTLEMVSIELTDTLSVGDNIKFVDGKEELFIQKVDLIQVGHEKPQSAGKGMVVGLKTLSPVQVGVEVFRI